MTGEQSGSQTREWSVQTESLPELSSNEATRYSRHIVLPEIGQQGQRRLKASSVVVIGAGGLGSPAAMYLAAAGVGRIGIVDFDTVDLSNLQRQIIHASRDVGMAKTESARERLAQINPEIVVDLFQEKIAADNVESIIASYDIVIDASDNFSTRYLINDACVVGKKPNVFGAIYRFEGQASVFAPDAGPCYRCLFPAPPLISATPRDRVELLKLALWWQMETSKRKVSRYLDTQS
jgi:adenylyltransferase/sulfurtransferase